MCLHEAGLEDHPEAATSPEWSAILGILWFIQVTSLLCELHRFPVAFWVEVKMLFIIFKVLQGTGGTVSP